jgi:hypothetical protein
VRAHPSARSSPHEDGVSCALRARVPLVVAGRVALNPYEEWADAVVEHGQVADACERVATLPSRAHTDVAQEALRAATRRRADSIEGATALVWRDHNRLRVRLEGLDRLDRSARDMVAAEVAAELRAFDAHAHDRHRRQPRARRASRVTGHATNRPWTRHVAT